MGIVELIEIGLAGAAEDRLEVAVLEPAEISIEAVAGLSQVVAQLARISLDFSPAPDTVRVAGSFDRESYLISIPGVPASGAEVLGLMWTDPDLAHGLAAAARMAARHGLEVDFLPGAARLTVPSPLVTRIENDELQPLQAVPDESPDDFVPHELDPRAGLGAATRRESSWSDSEAFLEEVFAPLMREWEESGQPATVASLAGREPGNLAVLGVRVPGESYALAEDDSPSTAPAEGAVDLRSALSTFDQGRKAANSG